MTQATLEAYGVVRKPNPRHDPSIRWMRRIGTHPTGERWKMSRGRKREMPVIFERDFINYDQSEFHRKHGHRVGLRSSIRTKSSKSNRSYKGKKTFKLDRSLRNKHRRRKL